MPAETTDVTDAFMAPHEETVVEGGLKPVEYELNEVTLVFPLMDMDDWAQCCSVLHSNRRRNHEFKLNANMALSPQDRQWLLMKFDDQPVLFMEAFEYRTQTPEGITITCKKSLIKGGMSKEDAAKAVKNITPVRQRMIARLIADPPTPLTKKELEAQKNAGKKLGPASTSETGTQTPDSSENSSAATQEA